MRSFNNDRGSSRGPRRDDDRRGGRRSDRPELFDAVCDDCGKNCKVPFRPSGDKPIYCSDCFEKRGNGNSDRDRNDRGGRRDFRDSRDSRDSRGSRDRDMEMYSAVCDDCGKDCEVPFKPTGEKPIYCSRCFEKRGNTHDVERFQRESGSNNDAVLAEINAKLDQIIAHLEMTKPKEVFKIIEVAKPKVKRAPKKAVEEVVVEE